MRQLNDFVKNNLDAVDPEDLLFFDPDTTPYLNPSEYTGTERRKLEQLQAWWRDAEKNPDEHAIYEMDEGLMEALEADGV